MSVFLAKATFTGVSCFDTGSHVVRADPFFFFLEDDLELLLSGQHHSSAGIIDLDHRSGFMQCWGSQGCQDGVELLSVKQALHQLSPSPTLRRLLRSEAQEGENVCGSKML